MDVSIIIVNYNTYQVTQNCLNSIFQFTQGLTYEVIVVDNNSQKDNSIENFKKNNNIILIENSNNIGFGKANNIGYQKAIGKYIFLLNSDTVLLNNAIKIFYDSMENLAENVACIGTRLKSKELNYNHSFGQFPSIKSTVSNILQMYLKPFRKSINSYNERDYDLLNQFEVDYIMGADLFIRKSVIEELGLFDPDFFMYYEESELQYRYKKAGYLSMIVSGPEIVHLENESTKIEGKKYNFNQRKIFITSLFLYMRKRYNHLYYLLFRMIFIFQMPIFFASYYTTIEKIKMLKLIFKLK